MNSVAAGNACRRKETFHLPAARAMNFNKTVIRKIKMAPVVAELFMA
jgi:hypothetical protein